MLLAFTLISYDASWLCHILMAVLFVVLLDRSMMKPWMTVPLATLLALGGVWVLKTVTWNGRGWSDVWYYWHHKLFDGIQAAFALAILKKREVVPFLLEALPRIKNTGERADALLSLAINEASAAVDLFEAELKAGRLGWRSEYLLALGRLKSARSIPLVLEVVRNPKGVLDRDQAIGVLKEIGVFTPEMRAALVEVMRSKNDYVGVKAGQVLADLSPGPDAEAGALMRKLAASVEADHWREVALETARRLEEKGKPTR